MTVRGLLTGKRVATDESTVGQEQVMHSPIPVAESLDGAGLGVEHTKERSIAGGIGHKEDG